MVRKENEEIMMFDEGSQKGRKIHNNEIHHLHYHHPHRHHHYHHRHHQGPIVSAKKDEEQHQHQQRHQHQHQQKQQQRNEDVNSIPLDKRVLCLCSSLHCGADGTDVKPTNEQHYCTRASDDKTTEVKIKITAAAHDRVSASCDDKKEDVKISTTAQHRVCASSSEQMEVNVTEHLLLNGTDRLDTTTIMSENEDEISHRSYQTCLLKSSAANPRSTTIDKSCMSSSSTHNHNKCVTRTTNNMAAGVGGEDVARRRIEHFQNGGGKEPTKGVTDSNSFSSSFSRRCLHYTTDNSRYSEDTFMNSIVDDEEKIDDCCEEEEEKAEEKEKEKEEEEEEEEEREEKEKTREIKSVGQKKDQSSEIIPCHSTKNHVPCFHNNNNNNNNKNSDNNNSRKNKNNNSNNIDNNNNNNNLSRILFSSRFSRVSIFQLLCIVALLFTAIPVTQAAADSNTADNAIDNGPARLANTNNDVKTSAASAAATLVLKSSPVPSSLATADNDDGDDDVESSPLDSVSPTSFFSSLSAKNSYDDNEGKSSSSSSSSLSSLPSPKSPLSSLSSPTASSSSSSSLTRKTTVNLNPKPADASLPSLSSILSPSLSSPPQEQPLPTPSSSSTSNSKLQPNNKKLLYNQQPPPHPSPQILPPQNLQTATQSPPTKPQPQIQQQPPPPTRIYPTTLKLGVNLQFNKHAAWSYHKVIPGIEIAKETILNTESLLPWITTIEINARDSKCSPTYAPLAAIDLYANKSAHVFLGPQCSYAASHVLKYCNRWKIPTITAGASESQFDNKSEYKLLTRIEAAYSKISPVFEAIFKRFGWNHIGFIYHDDGQGMSSCYQISYSMYKVMETRLSAVPVQMPFDQIKAGADGWKKVESILKQMTKRCNIIVLCASPNSVREIMIKAHDLNFDNGEYVFFSIDLFSSNDATSQPWHKDTDTKERNAKARKAYEALMMVTLRKPTSDEYRNFSRQVKERAKSMYENMTYGEQEVNSFVGAFHDAVILYAYALNETISAGGNVSDGMAITRRMWNRTIEGITGIVSIDENGDRNADYSLLDLNPKEERFEVVADYIGNKKEYQAVAGREIHWAGGREGPPPDKPKCGFDGSLCPPSKPFPEYGIVIIVLGSILLIILVIILIAWRHIKLQSELSEQNWRVKWEDIMIAGTTKSRNKSEQNRRESYDSNCSADTIAVHLSDGGNKQLFTKTGYYKGAILAIKPIYRTHFALQKSTLMEIKKMKDLQNDHLVRFQGICIDPPNQCMLTEYCPKGSLQDVLENEQLKLDWMFRYSIMQDIVRGMAYLHSTDIKSHGHLKSSNCVVDSRFVVKITDFGLPYFREREEELEEVTYARERSMLWTAPELLRMAEPPAAGTQKADVYSFAIICQEIVYRNGAFYIQNIDCSPREITERVRNGHRPPCRPTLEEYECPEDELAGLIRRCWSEDPADRPDFQNLRTLIKKMNKEGDKGDILDNLLSRMEQYATNLEALVDERTSDYLNEKKKAEELLYNMLPRQVASRLIQGKGISAEWYDEVTIYFSDICGFTALSAESTPMQVVDLLNDLYTCFDSILESFDVYKVETIGDAYMVVSGLPSKNGNLHAREIARMSLSLLDSVFKFRIRHRPDVQLKLRIGMHSGPVCAGVVGLKMPRYCLFGDTVNTSSRMESNGLALRIHVSPFTKEILDTFGTFQLEKRGAVEMKGKGAITTYWLNGEDGSSYNIRQNGYNTQSLSTPNNPPTQ